MLQLLVAHAGNWQRTVHGTPLQHGIYAGSTSQLPKAGSSRAVLPTKWNNRERPKPREIRSADSQW